jgi:hypothetical protein
MIQLEKQELQALVILKRVPEYKTLSDILEKRIRTISLANAIIKDDIQARWNQGRVQELLDLLKMFKTADEELHLFKSEARKHIE